MGKRKRIPEEARREQILEAAFAVACRKGIGRLSVRAVAGEAGEAGVSHTLVLFYFGRKANLVHELLDRVLDTTSVLHISGDIGSELERYRTAFRTIMEVLFEADPLLFPGATADGVAVSWIQGCAVQALVAPDQFDTGGYLGGYAGRLRPAGWRNW